MAENSVTDDDTRPPLDQGDPWYMGHDWSTADPRRLDEHGKRVGRLPLYCDSDRMRALLRAIEEGLYPNDAAAAAGIGRSAYFTWRDSVPVVGDAIRDAETVCKRGLLSVIRSAMPTNWQAAGWTLERRWPAEWGRRDRVKHEHEARVGVLFSPALMTESAAMLAASLEDELAAAEVAQRALPPHIAEEA